MSKKIWIAVAVSVALFAACVAQPLWTSSNVEQDHSPEQSYRVNLPAEPVAFTMSKKQFEQLATAERRCNRRCARRHDFKRMHSNFHHTRIRRHTMTRGFGLTARSVNIACRTEVMKLNWTDGIATMATAQGSIHRCWIPRTNHILMGDSVPVRYRATINHQCGVTDYGSAFLWHCDDQGTLVAQTNSRHCEGGECWDYMFRRWMYSFGRDLIWIHQHVNCHIDLTANGLGQGKGGANC